MTLPIHGTTKSIVFEEHVRHWKRDRHFAYLTPAQRDFSVLV
ncbi:hypothetical protein N788_00590 [Arenimonas donghaensis DSM 18148 = HO3-R19]|uniref:Uncharacterized protein n=1 Tax=Arenimonas donghaensis DSM 18148 = HO3-R19 TaxID=1121014 RepID=A0A087MLE6_9GAMM|nr:hypothetical protein N788_00590 [Arenimonas donghaensis DSM 18148 = HO3-R19]